MTRKNASMVEIENNRMFAIYESIMSEGLLGALGGAALGGLAGAAAGHFGGDAFKGTDLVKDATNNIATDTANANAAAKAAEDLKTAQNVAKQAKTFDFTAAQNDLEDAIQANGGGYDPNMVTQKDLASMNPDLADTIKDKVKTNDAVKASLDTIDNMSNAETNLKKAQDAAASTAKAAETKKAGAFDKAVKWSADNPVAAGAAAGAALGGVVGAFHNDDDRKDESDDDRLF